MVEQGKRCTFIEEKEVFSTRKKKKLEAELEKFLSLSQLLLRRRVRGKEGWSVAGNLIEGPAKLPWLCGTWRDKVCNS